MFNGYCDRRSGEQYVGQQDAPAERRGNQCRYAPTRLTARLWPLRFQPECWSNFFFFLAGRIEWLSEGDEPGLGDVTWPPSRSASDRADC